MSAKVLQNVIKDNYMVSTPSPNGSNGRDTGGRFARGNPGGPGNPHARRVAALRQTVLDTVGIEGITEIVGGLVAAAKAGDVAAAKLVLGYAIGQPTPAVDPDRLDADEARVFTDLADALGDFHLRDLVSPDDVRLAVEQATGDALECAAGGGCTSA
jgi:hypothetical protein